MIAKNLCPSPTSLHFIFVLFFCVYSTILAFEKRDQCKTKIYKTIYYNKMKFIFIPLTKKKKNNLKMFLIINHIYVRKF